MADDSKDDAKTQNRAYFQKAYRTGEHGWPIEDPSPYVVRFLEQIRQEAPGGRVLDLGCGEGRHAIAAARMGFEVTGMDFEPLALKRARYQAERAGTPNITFRKGDALDLPYRSPRFDAIIDYGCLHHQRKTDWPTYRTGLLRALKAGGFYAVSVFSPEFHLFRDSSRVWHVDDGVYRRCFRPADLMAFAGKRFEIQDLEEERNGDRGFWHALMRRTDAA